MHYVTPIFLGDSEAWSLDDLRSDCPHHAIGKRLQHELRRARHVGYHRNRHRIRRLCQRTPQRRGNEPFWPLSPCCRTGFTCVGSYHASNRSRKCLIWKHLRKGGTMLARHTPRSPMATIPAFFKGWRAWLAQIPYRYYRLFGVSLSRFLYAGCTFLLFLFLSHNPFIHRLRHSFIFITAIALFSNHRSLDSSFDFYYWHRL